MDKPFCMTNQRYQEVETNESLSYYYMYEHFICRKAKYPKMKKVYCACMSDILQFC